MNSRDQKALFNRLMRLLRKKGAHTNYDKDEIVALVNVLERVKAITTERENQILLATIERKENANKFRTQSSMGPALQSAVNSKPE